MTAAEAGPVEGLRSLVRQSLAYSLGSVGYKAVALISVPLLARLLDPAGLGLLDLATLTGGLVAVGAGLGLDQAVARHERLMPAGVLWSSALVGVGGACLMLLLIGGPALAGVGAVAGVPTQALLVGLVYGCSLAFVAVTLNAVRLRGSPREYSTVSFAVAVSEAAAAVAVAALVGAEIPLIVMFWTLINAAAALIVLRRRLPPLLRPQSSQLRRLIVFGLPLVPATLAWAISDLVVRLTIEGRLGIGQVGVFGVATRLQSVLMIFVAAFSVAWHPTVYRMEEERVTPSAVVSLIGLVCILGAGAIVLAGLAPELVAVAAGDRFAAATQAIPSLAFGALGLAVFTLASAVHGYANQTRLVGGAATIGAIAQAGLAQVAIPSLDLLGAGLAIASGFWVAALVLVPVILSGSRRRPFLQLAAAMGVCAVCLIGLSALMEMPVLPRVLVSSLGLAALLLIWRWSPRAA